MSRIETTYRICRVEDCRLKLSREAWGFADAHAQAIAAHWQRRTAENPAFFNGQVYMLKTAPGHRWLETGAVMAGELIGVAFAGLLYWKDHDCPEAGVRDAFGSAIIRSREGHILLGRQRAGNVNGGMAYPPGGFIDTRDVRADGSIDIGASIDRELAEETGLSAKDAPPTPGFWRLEIGAQVSLGREYVSAESAETLRARMLEHVASESEPELADIVIVRSRADIDDSFPEFTRALLVNLLA